MTASGGSAEEPTVYTIRVSEAAAGVIEAEWDRLDDLAGAEVAEAWRIGMRTVITGLATYPERCAAAVEDRLFPGGALRQLVYQRRRGGPVWRILFSVRPANADDPPTVRVHLIRHGSKQPMTEWPAEDET